MLAKRAAPAAPAGSQPQWALLGPIIAGGEVIYPLAHPMSQVLPSQRVDVARADGQAVSKTSAPHTSALRDQPIERGYRYRPPPPSASGAPLLCSVSSTPGPTGRRHSTTVGEERPAPSRVPDFPWPTAGKRPVEADISGQPPLKRAATTAEASQRRRHVRAPTLEQLHGIMMSHCSPAPIESRIDRPFPSLEPPIRPIARRPPPASMASAPPTPNAAIAVVPPTLPAGIAPISAGHAIRPGPPFRTADEARLYWQRTFVIPEDPAHMSQTRVSLFE